MKGAQSAKVEPQPLLLRAPRENARIQIAALWRVLKRAAMAWVDVNHDLWKWSGSEQVKLGSGFESAAW